MTLIGLDEGMWHNTLAGSGDPSSGRGYTLIAPLNLPTHCPSGSSGSRPPFPR